MTKHHIFISHSWAYGDAYDKLVALLNKAPYFDYVNHSVPEGNPIHTSGTDRELYAAIKERIKYCSTVLILAGVYSSYSKWIGKEIEICKNEFTIPKRIVAVQPWGAEKTSQIVKQSASHVVGWSTNSIVNAVRGAS